MSNNHYPRNDDYKQQTFSVAVFNTPELETAQNPDRDLILTTTVTYEGIIMDLWDPAEDGANGSVATMCLDWDEWANHMLQHDHSQP